MQQIGLSSPFGVGCVRRFGSVSQFPQKGRRNRVRSVIRSGARGLAVVAAVVVGATGCGAASRSGSSDGQHEQRIASESAGYPVNVRCEGDACALAVRSRLHSQNEAILVGWPILAGWATDRSLNSVRRVALTLSDTSTGAQLALTCRLSKARTIPAGQTDIATVKQRCSSHWRARY
jgi:hypothetical protein